MPKQGDEIVNPRTGQRMVFVQTRHDTSGQLLRIETVNPGHSAPEPEHVHPFQESSCEVISGKLRFSIAGREQDVGPGEIIRIPANVRHFFWNNEGEEARAIQEFKPALTIAEFFETYFFLARDGKLNDKGMPNLLQMAAMHRVFDRDIRVTKPPRWVQVVVLGLLAPVARMLGYRARS